MHAAVRRGRLGALTTVRGDKQASRTRSKGRARAPPASIAGHLKTIHVTLDSCEKQRSRGLVMDENHPLQTLSTTSRLIRPPKRKPRSDRLLEAGPNPTRSSAWRYTRVIVIRVQSAMRRGPNPWPATDLTWCIMLRLDPSSSTAHRLVHSDSNAVLWSRCSPVTNERLACAPARHSVCAIRLRVFYK